MAGSDTPATTTENKTSISQPWAPAQPLLNSILGQLGGKSTAPTPDQTGAIQNLQTAANSIPNFGAAGAGAIGNAFGTNTNPQQGLLSDAFNTQKANLTPWANGSNNDPMSNPGFRDMLNTAKGDITNDITSRFAAAGRSGSPAETQSLSRGLSQGLGGILSNQYNTNVGNQMSANSALMSGAGSTAGGLTAQQLAALQAQQSGITGAGMLSNLFTQPAQTQLSAANAGFSQPFQNIGMLEGLVNPIAGLGGQTNSTGTGTQTPANSPNSNLMGGIMGGAGMAMQMLPMMLSDERAKEDIEPVGKLNDGQDVYSYKYKHDASGRTHIGLLAQEVEKIRPDAVAEFGPARIKAVDYSKATERSRAIGMLSDLMAA